MGGVRPADGAPPQRDAASDPLTGREATPTAVLAIGLSVVCLACAPRPAAAATVVGDGQDGATVKVAAGSTLIVRLLSNPSTGFTWRMTGATPGLRLLAQRYEPAHARRGVVGAGGVQTFRLRVTGAPGAATPLKFAYNRWWKAMPFARVWSAKIVVVR